MQKLKIIEVDGNDITFVVPWKNQEVRVRYEAPAGCISAGFRFDVGDDDEEEFENFLWDRIDISTTVTLQGE